MQWAAGMTAVSSGRSLNADGSLALWQRENVMTTLRGELAGVAHNGFLYALGGTYGDSGRTTEFAHINADGSLGTWQQSTSMIERVPILPRSRTTASSTQLVATTIHRPPLAAPPFMPMVPWGRGNQPEP